jgi:SAM-dependent methyltransferase
VAALAGPAGRARCRAVLLAGLHGRVLEVGAGRGQNFPYYPSGVSHLTAVEPSRRPRNRARAVARQAGTRIEMVAGTAGDLPGQVADYDAVIACLALCSVPDQQAALGVIGRVLRPGGQLRYFEHVVCGRPALARLERLLDSTLYPLLARGCHCGRDTGAAIRQAGFHVEQEARIAVRDAQLGPSVQHILGIARARLNQS